MEESSDQPNDKVEMECDVLKMENNDTIRIDKPEVDSSSKQINNEIEMKESSDEKESTTVGKKHLSISKSKETCTGTRVKRKARSTRRRLNAMVNNTSLHFSDTDSEGELTTINSRSLSPAKTRSLDIHQAPVISIMLDETEPKGEPNEILNCLSPEDKGISPSCSFMESLTDVDEIYASEPENEQRDGRNSLTVLESPCQAETDLEDFEGEDEVQSTIYVEPRGDIFCEGDGETITTKEGDGPFSVEIRNKMYSEEEFKSKKQMACNDTPDIIVLTNTDEEDMDVSSEEELEEACCSHREILEDFDVLAASQIIMKNINKMENLLNVKDISDDVISDCCTDVEDVE